MKKFLTMISAAAVLLCGILFTSCGAAAAVVDYLAGTYNTWYKYTGTATIPLGNSEDDLETSAALKTLEGVEFFVYFNPQNGLKVALQASKDQNVELYNGLVNTNMKVYMGGTKDYTAEQFGSIRWSALITTGKFVPATTPKIVSNPEECILLNAQSFKIQWKKVLANYLINLLLT